MPTVQTVDVTAGDGRDGACQRPSVDGWTPRSSAAEQLLAGSPFEVSRRFARRERLAEGVLAALWLIAALAMALTLPVQRTAPPGLAVALIVAYALAARVCFSVGAGFAVPTQLLLVPMLFVLPTPAVPLFVAAGLLLSAVPDVLTRRGSPERLVSAVADAWHAIGPAFVLAVAASPTASMPGWRLLSVALAAQFGVDLLVSATREAVGRDIAPKQQLSVLAWVYLVDLLLTPAGFAAAWVGLSEPYAALLGLPLVGLLALLAHDRNHRIRHALELSRVNRDSAIALGERIEELQRERARVDSAIKRIGKALSSSLDRPELLEVVRQTAIDALSAERGRVITRSPNDEPGIGDYARTGGLDSLERAMAAAEAAALRQQRTAEVQVGEAHAIACLLEPSKSMPSVLALARGAHPFADRERDLLEYLTSQAAASIDNIALHELAQRQAVTDELTGLSNHRRLHEFLATEIERSRRSGLPVALVMVDIDHFKAVNDSHGHQVGDLVLRNIAGLVADHCRAGDEPARYGGEELALALPDTTLNGAYEVAERLRRTIETFETVFDGRSVKVTGSLGVAALSRDDQGVADLISAADAALYEAKRTGRNRTVRADALSRRSAHARRLVSRRRAG